MDSKLRNSKGRIQSMEFDDLHDFYICALRLISNSQDWKEGLIDCDYFFLEVNNIHNIEVEFLSLSREKFNIINLVLPIDPKSRFFGYSKILELDNHKSFHKRINSYKELSKRRNYVKNLSSAANTEFLKKEINGHVDYNSKTLFLFTSIYVHQFLSKPPRIIRKIDFDNLVSSINDQSQKEKLKSFYKPYNNNYFKLEKPFNLKHLRPFMKDILLYTIYKNIKNGKY